MGIVENNSKESGPVNSSLIGASPFGSSTLECVLCNFYFNVFAGSNEIVLSDPNLYPRISFSMAPRPVCLWFLMLWVAASRSAQAAAKQVASIRQLGAIAQERNQL